MGCKLVAKNADSFILQEHENLAFPDAKGYWVRLDEMKRAKTKLLNFKHHGIIYLYTL